MIKISIQLFQHKIKSEKISQLVKLIWNKGKMNLFFLKKTDSTFLQCLETIYIYIYILIDEFCKWTLNIYECCNVNLLLYHHKMWSCVNSVNWIIQLLRVTDRFWTQWVSNWPGQTIY